MDIKPVRFMRVVIGPPIKVERVEQVEPDVRTLIMDTVDDAVADLITLDRSRDEELPEGAIEQAIADGVVTVDEIVERFRAQLLEELG